VVDLPGRVAVDGVGARRAKRLNVERVDAGPDFLIGRESNLDRAARDVRVLEQGVDKRDDRRDPRLVVRPEQRRPVRRDHVVADHRAEDGVRRRGDDLRGIARQDDVAAAIVMMDDRRHVAARQRRRRVDVGEEPDDRDWRAGRHIPG
jgi:hypothetical protein